MNRATLRDFLENEIEKKLFSAYQFSVKEKGLETFSGFGGTISFKDRQKIGINTPFDVASLTKVIFTVPLVYNLIYKNILSIDDSAGRFIKGTEEISIIDLLGHTSGYPAWIPFYEKINGSLTIEQKKEKAVEIISVMDRKKGKRIYSDINYILLGFILEKIYKKPLDAVFSEFLIENRINSDICFNPAKEVPLTSYSVLRENYPDKTVEDENSYFFGGKTGHAGLFASAKATADYFDRLLKKEWFKKVLRDLNFAGFDKPEGGNSNYGLNPDPETQIGHLGFTGTAILIDLKKQKIATLFTNATHPSSQKINRKERIKKVRQQFFSLLT